MTKRKNSKTKVKPKAENRQETKPGTVSKPGIKPGAKAGNKGKAEAKIGRVRMFFGEFKKFAVKGSMLDMAVGMIVGGAFTALVTSIVGNLATPLIGILIGVDFSDWTIELPRLYGNVPPGTLAIGAFINSAISFVVVAFVVFLFVKAINKFRNSEEGKPVPPPKPTNEELLLTEIRDILRDGAKKGKKEEQQPE